MLTDEQKARAYDRKAKYDQEYQKRTYKQIRLNVRKDDPILQWLDNQPNKQGYIVELIRADMKKRGLSD